MYNGFILGIYKGFCIGYMVIYYKHGPINQISDYKLNTTVQKSFERFECRVINTCNNQNLYVYFISFTYIQTNKRMVRCHYSIIHI